MQALFQKLKFMGSSCFSLGQELLADQLGL
jgi:hypothetical protein